MTAMPLKFRDICFILVFVATASLLRLDTAKADQIVVPNYATNSQVPNAGEGLFNVISRHQIVYEASQFPSYPIVISQIQWRPDIFTEKPITNTTITNIQINLSTTTNRADHLSPIFSENTGTNDIVVFSGTLVLNTSLSTLSNGTTAFDMNVPLQAPFFFDPSKGNLLLDVRDFTGASESIYDNGTSGSSDGVSRVFSTFDPNAITANASDTGGGAIQITYGPAAALPTIVFQPTNQSVLVNDDVSFFISAVGSPTPAYQWFFNDLAHPILGATNNVLTFLNVQTNQAGIYFAQVANSFGPILSSNASLTVSALPVFTVQPKDEMALIGGTAIFSVTVSSGVSVAYQWFFKDTNLIIGATNSDLILTNIQFDQLGFYSVRATNFYGSALSSNAALSATPLIVPNNAANIQPGSGIEDTFFKVERIQTVYGASQFPSYPILITELRWRPSTLTGGPLTDAVPNIQIDVSTTAAQADSLDFTYANNVGLDATTVFSGPATVATAFGTLTNGTKAFDISFPLQKPFLYDPSKGNLLIDIKNFSGGSTFLYTDGLAIGGDSVSRIVNDSATATSASGADTAGEAIQIFYGPTTIPPLIFSQPTNRFATLGSSNAFTVVAGSVTPVSYQWYFANINNPISGGTNASLILTNVQQDQAGIYFVRVTNIYDSTFSSNAILSVTTDPPQITAQPASHSGVVGTNLTFSVSAFGSLPLAYQWFYNTNTLIVGATHSSLVLSNVQFDQSGTYSVVVSNAYGITNSTYAVLTISFPPAKVFMGTTNVMGGSPFSLPVYLVANGNENALTFSVGFNTPHLTYASVDLGSGAADAGLLLNTSQSASGKVGVQIALPSGETFAPGTQEVARITFTSGFITNTPIVTPVNFTNLPTSRAVSDINLVKLATNFVNSSVTLGITDFEGDVNPRTTGNRTLDIFDWNQVGRFVAGLDIVSNASEFQRADSAPTNTSGDGMLKVNDWVQAGRYGAAVDAPNFVSGPTAPVTPVILTGGPRIVNIAGGIGVKGLNVTVPVTLQSQGNENAVGFSVNFDPTLLKYVSATKGSSDASATLLVNSNQASSGIVGVILALQSGNNFTNGTQPEIAKLTFTALDTTTNGIVKFTNGPVLLAISDSAATELAAIYSNNMVTINPPPTLAPSLSSTNAIFSWPIWGGGFNLQGTGDLTQPWTNVFYTAQTNGLNIIITLPIPTQGGYFRLQHP
jgi:hypothetical protein